MGNPVGVLLDADGLAEAAMRAIVCAVGFNETAFVLPSTRADLRLRYFTPGHEVDVCGHATVGTFVVLHQRGRTRPAAQMHARHFSSPAPAPPPARSAPTTASTSRPPRGLRC